MKPSEIPIPQDIALEVFLLACQYYSEKFPCYSVSYLMETAIAVLHIPPELIERSVREIQEKHKRSAEIRISEELASEVFTLASQYHADREQSYSVADLVDAGAEVGLPPETILKAVREIQGQSQPKKQRHKKLFKLSLGGVLAALSLWSCTYARWDKTIVTGTILRSVESTSYSLKIGVKLDSGETVFVKARAADKMPELIIGSEVELYSQTTDSDKQFYEFVPPTLGEIIRRKLMPMEICRLYETR